MKTETLKIAADRGADRICQAFGTLDHYHGEISDIIFQSILEGADAKPETLQDKFKRLNLTPRPWTWDESIKALIELARTQAECLHSMSTGVELSRKWEAVEKAQERFLNAK